jgi:hypothetical protein
MTRELHSLLARLDDVIARMPDSFNTYEFAQKLALQHQQEYFAAGHSWRARRRTRCACSTRRLPGAGEP